MSKSKREQPPPPGHYRPFTGLTLNEDADAEDHTSPDKPLVAEPERGEDDLFAEPRLATKTTSCALPALEKADVRSLLADMLSHSEARVRELAAELHPERVGVLR